MQQRLAEGRGDVGSGECWIALGIPARDRSARNTARLAECLEALGFRRAEDQPKARSHAGVLWTRVIQHTA